MKHIIFEDKITLFGLTIYHNIKTYEFKDEEVSK